MRVCTHDLEALRQEFASIKEPARPKEMVGVAFETFDVKVPIHGVPIPLRLGPLKRWWERRTTRQLIELGAWQWLRPEQPGRAGHLEALRNWLGLTNLEQSTFCSQLADACVSLANKYPKLDRFIRGQVAEAEFGFVPSPGLSEPLIRGYEEFQSHLIVAALTRDSEIAIDVSRSALQGAARIVHDVLSGNAARPCRFDVNLMLPFPAIDAYGGLPGAKAADELWSDCGEHPHQFFVVVESVGPEKYKGFWIPDVRPDNHPLPGAPSASFFGRTQAIHLDDLPPLPLRNQVTRGKWHHYLSSGKPDGFSGSMFVSVPVLSGGPAQGQRSVVGIVNVNIQDERPWHRAYSPAWLDRAGILASSYITTSWHAFMLARGITAGIGIGPALDCTLPTLSLRPAFTRHLLPSVTSLTPPTQTLEKEGKNG